jgi:glycine dehydrogenase subunit 2
MIDTIFKRSKPGRGAKSQRLQVQNANPMPKMHCRKGAIGLPGVSELEAVRHYTGLSQMNFSIDTQFYPLGSCTMKYNPRAAHRFASDPAFLSHHPHTPAAYSQGILSCLFELQDFLKQVTGMDAVSLAPMAGAQGEFCGVAMIKAYHEARGQGHRHVMLVPDTAHGTNPASAVICGYDVVEVKTTVQGDVDIPDLESKINDNIAGIMLTNPSTGGVFERNIELIAKKIHAAGGLLYYDGANLNAMMGVAKPAVMGFDVMHMNLHKTFATPHGGGGPGSGPVACQAHLTPYLPIPYVIKKEERYLWADKSTHPKTMGPVGAFAGNVGILLRAYIYARLLGGQGILEAAELATLNANYLLSCLVDLGIEAAYPGRRATHECLVTFKKTAKSTGVTAKDIAKRLLDYGVHAPTTYFPLVVPECFLIEPTETESKQEIDRFVDIMKTILDEVKNAPELVKSAPHTMPVTRLDDVKAARELDVVFKCRGE